MRSTYVGQGWYIRSMTDRLIWLTKPDPIYWNLTGDDGFVKVRIEPQMTREQAFDKAVKTALETDAALSYRVAAQCIPTARAIHIYRRQLDHLKPVFAIPDEEKKRYTMTTPRKPGTDVVIKPPTATVTGSAPVPGA